MVISESYQAIEGLFKCKSIRKCSSRPDENDNETPSIIVPSENQNQDDANPSNAAMNSSQNDDNNRITPLYSSPNDNLSSLSSTRTEGTENSTENSGTENMSGRTDASTENDGAANADNDNDMTPSKKIKNIKAGKAFMTSTRLATKLAISQTSF